MSYPHTFLWLHVHCKKRLPIFPSPAGMSLTKLSLAGKQFNYSRPGESLTTFFYSVYSSASVYLICLHKTKPLHLHKRRRAWQHGCFEIEYLATVHIPGQGEFGNLFLQCIAPHLYIWSVCIKLSHARDNHVCFEIESLATVHWLCHHCWASL